MRFMRLSFFFLLGLMLGGTVVLAHAAETQPAVQKPLRSGFMMDGKFYTSPDAACSAFGGSDYHVEIGGTFAYGCQHNQYSWITYSIEPSQSCGDEGTAPLATGCPYECPSGWDGPMVIDSVPNLCTRHACEAGKVTGTGFRMFPANSSGANPITCNGECEESHTLSIDSSAGFDPYTVTKEDGSKFVAGWWSRTLTGNSCTSGGGVPDTPPETPPLPEPKKKPPCGASEGVLTTQSGAVRCVPEGTPDAPKPKVEQKKREETFQDGSTKTTEETKTTDTRTGATHTATTTTTTSASSGSAGEAGEPGVRTGESGESGSCEGEDCADGDTPGEFPEYGTLYEKKYPDGVTGVLNDKWAAMKATPIGSLASQLAPTTLPSSGTCPSFSFGSNIGPGMPFGGGSFAPPCYVWDFIRVVFLISSLLLARRLIFGG